MLNIGFTHAGLLALGLQPSWLAPFPKAFREGPGGEKRAAANGDVGESAPVNWIFGAPGGDEHVMLLLHACKGGGQSVEADSRAIRNALADGQTCGLALRSEHGAAALAEGREHFGYRDGIAQPRLANRLDGSNDMQPAVSPGEFLLGESYQDIFGGSSIGKLPLLLAKNGTFCAVRVLAHRVEAFQRLLDGGAAQLRISRDLVAAKLVGRWFDGQPLALYPNEASRDSAPGEIFGLFYCGSLERQFEFIQQQWVHGYLFASGVRGTQDPIGGARGTLLYEVARQTSPIPGARLKPLEGAMTLLQFVLGGYLSTEFLLTTGTRNLLRDNRRQWILLPDDLERRLPCAIEEMRRLDTPLGVIDPFAASDISFGGLDVPFGSRLMGMLGSANRHEEAFGCDADRFDITRSPAECNLALGRGIHECIGKPLQEVVATIALRELVLRFPDLRLASPAQPPWFPDPYFRSFSRLTVCA